ncbi:hypothetical protein N0V93_000725 [Gnomoniopsis smithogilvyi]|uniref:AB hydrolase-1 domain-containing protein n=1 Tax=Gnomoniopsis smithogilvyi TaxID=1191159 RepID=A0A9W8Z096_9PEZI|nr:hypothetical protein N0V93_000725 [Gnomoniopsis smithogilvyi]
MSTQPTAPEKPTVLIVPGAWQLTTAFVPFIELLNKSGYETEIVKLPSTGGTELPLTGLPEDIAAIRAVLEPLVEAGKNVLLLTHSAGGVSGSGAMKDLDTKTRKSAGLAGGVTRVVYMGAFMIPKGSSLMEMLGGKPLPWMVIEGDRVTGDPELMPQVGLGDLSPEEIQKWSKEMSHTSAALFVGTSQYEPWANGVPCAYIFTKQDGALPFSLQQKMAEQLGPNPLTVEIDSNHCPFLSRPEELLSAINTIASA